MSEVLEIPRDDDLVECRRRLLHEHELLEDLGMLISELQPFLCRVSNDLLTCDVLNLATSHPERLGLGPPPIPRASRDVRNPAMNSMDEQDGWKLVIFWSCMRRTSKETTNCVAGLQGNSELLVLICPMQLLIWSATSLPELPSLKAS